jgi:DNA-binding transcriptional MocR family regulator
VVIVEDEPYWYLQFPSAATEEAKSRGLPSPAPTRQHKPGRSSGYAFLDSLTPSFLSLDTDGRVVRLDTFSKTVAPGCRLGWITAQPTLIERFERIAESTTQQPSGFVQGMISELVLGSNGSGDAKAANQRARTAFSLLRSPRDRAAFAGWDTSGWVRWLEGLRGAYERRVGRMCRTLDEGATLLTTAPVSASASDSEWAPLAVTKTTLYSFRWPRGGMFIWLRVHLESHPLWQARGPSPQIPVLDGPVLAAALMIWLTTKPFRVLVATGSMFSANDEVRVEDGWKYHRICFAAEDEANVDLAAERFVEGVRRFWEVTDARVVERLLGELGPSGEVEALGEGVSSLGWYMGC